jgi:nucleoprotein TPR
VPLSYEVDRTRKELDSLSAHKQWLEKELQERNQLLVQEKQKHSEQILDLSQKLDVTVTERDEFKSTIGAFKQSQQNLRNKTEELSLELREAKEEAANIKESSQQELHQERRLVELQKEQLDRLTHLYSRVVKENESLRELGNQASQTTQRGIEEVRLSAQEEAQRILEEHNDRHSRQIELLKKQLDDANRRRKAAEDGFLASPRPRLGPPKRPMLMQDDDEPLGLTDLYQRLAQTEDALQEKTTQCKRFALMLEKIQAEVEAKSPVLMRQRAECELAKQQVEESRYRLEGALGELASVRQDLKEVSLDKEELRKHNRELRQETTDLAKQVQALLVSRAGGEADSEIPITVEEIQTQNQQLLQEHRRLSSTIAELDEKLRTDPVQRELEKAKEELVTLRVEREKQENFVIGIVQQRDMYRGLLAKHDGALVGEGTDPVAAQTEKNKALSLRNGELETNFAKARAEVDGLTRDKETLEHRVARYETHTTELTSFVNKLQSELSSANATVARTKADATYHSEKCVRLEETLQQSRSEVQRTQGTINQLYSVNANLQKAVASANEEASKWEQESRQVSLYGIKSFHLLVEVYLTSVSSFPDWHEASACRDSGGNCEGLRTATLL